MKNYLFEKKRKNVFINKQMKDIEKKGDISKVYFQMQQDYIVLRKKKEDYTQRLWKIQQDNIKVLDQ